MALIIQVCFKKIYICHGHEELEKIEIIWYGKWRHVLCCDV